MADFSITVSNSISCLGPGPTTKWNAFDWGTGLWGAGSVDLQTDTVKAISEAIALADTLAVSAQFMRTITNEISGTFEMSSETLKSGNWNYVFTKPTTDAENRNPNAFTEVTDPSTTWASGVATSTSWSTA